MTSWSLYSMHPRRDLGSFTFLHLSPAFPIPAKRGKPRSSGPQVTTSNPAVLWSSLKMGRVSMEGSQQCGGGKGAVNCTMIWAPFSSELITVSKDKAIHVLDVEQGRLERRISKAHG